MVVTISEYKGNKLIELKQNDEDKYSFRFGVRKARLILDHINEIQQFVQEYE